jgi:hypothetical protein
VQHGDSVDAEQGRLQQRVQCKGHGCPNAARRPSRSSPAATADVARPQPALTPTEAGAAQNALSEKLRPPKIRPHVTSARRVRLAA